jgi:hypothetical protein
MIDQPHWSFLEKPQGAKARDPMQEEFFQDQSIDGIDHALIRETVQNSLDARIGNHPVKIVFSLGQLTADRAKYWFPKQVQAHFSAKEIRLNNLPNWGAEECAYLTIEDFNTKGLEGKIDSADPKTGGNFYHFFRAEGVSNKRPGERGSWGVGKIVIPRSSRVRSFFAITRRASEPGLHLMGQAILRHHEVEGKIYTPDGWFSEEIDGLQTPFSDNAITDRLKYDFGLRREKEPGLGLVIPWIYEDYLTFNRLAAVIAREYFISILSGDLIIELNDSRTDQFAKFDADSLSELKSAAPDDDEFQDSIYLAGSLLGMEQFEAVTANVSHITGSSVPDYDWSNYITDIPPQDIELALDRGNVVHFKVPMIIQPTKATPETGHFDVLLKKKTGRHYPIFVRDGLLIPNHPTRKKTPDHIALICASANIVAETLGKSECPAHTDWKASRDKFREQHYREGNRLISFVRDSAQKLVGKLSNEEGKPDHSLLAELLPLPANDAPSKPTMKKEAVSREKEKKEVIDLVTPEIPPIASRCWKLQQVGKEVHLRGNPSGFENARGYRLTLQAAYDIHGRNPFNSHSKYDFDLIRAAREGVDKKSKFHLNLNEHVEIIDGDHGRLTVMVTSPEFEILFRPADLHRDLIMKVNSLAMGEYLDDEEIAE